MRDLDLIRDILLYAEANAESSSVLVSLEGDEFPGYSDKRILNQIRLLDEAGYLQKRSGGLISPPSWQGYDLLDSIRDPKIWRKTKETAEKAGGFTFSLLGEIAKGLIKTKIKKHTGLEF